MEAAVTKLMMLVGLLASFALFDPMKVMDNLGPQASLLGWKIKSNLDVARAFPQWEFFRGR